jgi:hypothetical protein
MVTESGSGDLRFLISIAKNREKLHKKKNVIKESFIIS